MRRRLTPSEHCNRASQLVSLHLDGELSELEHARLEEHLESCAGCRALAAELTGLTKTLRSAPLEEPSIPYHVPNRRYAGAYALRATSLTAAVAAVVLSGVVGLRTFVERGILSGRSPAVDVRTARAQMAVKELLLDQLESVGHKVAPQVRPDLARAERVTIGRDSALHAATGSGAAQRLSLERHSTSEGR